MGPGKFGLKHPTRWPEKGVTPMFKVSDIYSSGLGRKEAAMTMRMVAVYLGWWIHIYRQCMFYKSDR